MGVQKADLEKMDKENQRAKIGIDTRLSYDADIHLLVIKMMPSKAQLGHLTLAQHFTWKLRRMGLPPNCLGPVGGTKYELPDSSKESDTAYCPRQFRTHTADWPTITFESGFPETLSRLRHDAAWWIVKSQGDVKIVIIISLRPAQKWLVIEKWCPFPPPANRPATRANPNANVPIPTKVQELTIIQNPTPQQGPTPQSQATGQQISTVQPGTASAYDIAGAPLTLEFNTIFLRNPAPPEGDIVFNAPDLALVADAVWEYLE